MIADTQCSASFALEWMSKKTIAIKASNDSEGWGTRDNKGRDVLLGVDG